MIHAACHAPAQQKFESFNDFKGPLTALALIDISFYISIFTKFLVHVMHGHVRLGPPLTIRYVLPVLWMTWYYTDDAS